MRRNCTSLIFGLYMFLTTFLHAGEQVTVDKPGPPVPAQEKVLPSTPNTLSKPLTIEQIRTNIPTGTADRFEFLRRQRKTTLDAIDETSSQVKALIANISVVQSRLDSLFQTQERVRFGPPPPPPRPPRPASEILQPLSKLYGMSKEQLTEALKLAMEDIKKAKETLSAADSQKEPEERKRDLIEKENYGREVERALDSYDQRQEEAKERKEEMDERKQEMEQRKQEMEQRKTKVEADMKASTDELAQLNEQRDKTVQLQFSYQRLLGEIDDMVNQLFIASDVTNSFKLRMSITFSVLVGIVIAGFFIIAWSNEDVKKTIFSNESGIQFITLFAIVIAVILFGIINILEGRELSALLGGLSGYILGRGREK